MVMLMKGIFSSNIVFFAHFSDEMLLPADPVPCTGPTETDLNSVAEPALL